MGDGTRQTVDEYVDEASGWERDVLNKKLAGDKAARWAAGVLAVLLACALLVIASLLPLKRVDGYVVSVDRHSGETRVLTSLRETPGRAVSLTEDEALTKAQLAGYVIARETFDLVDIEERHRTVRLMSERKLFDAYDRTFRGPRSVNPFYLYEGVTREIEVKSVEFFNDNTAQVRFRADAKRDGTIHESHFVAIVRFRFVQTPVNLKERLANPLGFQAVSYRVDQESV